MIQSVRRQVVIHVLGLGRHHIVDPVELAARAGLFALFNGCEICVEALLTLVIVVLDMVLPAVQQIKTAGNEDGDNAYSAIEQ